MQPADLFPLLAPLCLVLVGACACIGAEPFLAGTAKHRVLGWVAVLALLAAGAAQGFLTDLTGHLHGMIVHDPARAWLSLAVIASAGIAVAGLQQSLWRDGYPGGEGYALLQFAAAGALLMVMANDSIALFVGLELASLSVYALVGMRRQRLDSNEGMLKYFAMGAVFSAIFLYGAALSYGATASTRFGGAILEGRDNLHMLGQVLMAIGLLFKVGVVPFHFWSPDAYTAAPAAVTGFMGAAIKVGGFAALGCLWLNLVAISSGTAGTAPLALNAEVQVSGDGIEMLGRLQLVLLVLGLLSLVLGNFGALRQTSTRRMIAYSSVAHAGYMLLAFALPTGKAPFQLAPLWYYLVAYALATAGALTAVASMAGKEDNGEDIDGLAGMGRAKPLQGLALTVFLASFAGIPPTAGFLGKYLVFSELVARGKIAVALFAMLMAVVGAAYYLRLTIAIWAPRPTRVLGPQPVLAPWAVAVAAIATVLLLVAPPALLPRAATVPPPAAASR